jgi:hypothetical protein
LLIFLSSCSLIAVTPASADGNVWFARAEATGDGTSAANPIGSSAALDAATKPGDTIILLPGARAFDGGVALKTGQTLINAKEIRRGRDGRAVRQPGGSKISLSMAGNTVHV